MWSLLLLCVLASAIDVVVFDFAAKIERRMTSIFEIIIILYHKYA